MDDPSIELPKIARDTAYTLIGLGILAVQAGQVARRRLGIRVDPLAAVNGLLHGLLDPQPEEEDPTV